MSTKTALLIFYSITLFCIIFGCSISAPAPTAGGSSGGEAYAIVKGVVTNESKEVVEGAIVTLRLELYENELISTDNVYLDTTNSDGYFAFDSISQGNYSILIVDPLTTLSRKYSFSILENTPEIAFETVILSKSGSLSCRVDLDNIPETASIQITVLGTEKQSTSQDGKFFLRLAAGEYTLILSATHAPSQTTIIHGVTIHPEEVTSVNHVGLPFQKVNDSLKIISFFEKQGIAQREYENIVSIRFNRIRALDLSHQSIINLHPSIGTLSSLNRIRLDANPGIQIPESLVSLPVLNQISFDTCGFDSFPHVLTRCLSLNSISFVSNNLFSLPDSIQLLVNLKTLNLSSNAFTQFPSVILKNYSLETIDLRGNEIDSLPDTIGNLTGLKSLILSSNNLTMLPETLKNCTTLKSLQLWSNNFTSFPAVITQLSSLEDLHLQNNAIDSIPESIVNMQNLARLHISSNNLSTLPHAITSLTNIDQISVTHNRLCTVDNQIALWLNKKAEENWRESQRDCK